MASRDGPQTGTMAAQVSVLRDKNWKMKRRTEQLSEEVTRGFLYSVMLLFGLLSTVPIDSPLAITFPVNPAPPWPYNCTTGPQASYIIFTCTEETPEALHAIDETMSLLGDSAPCPLRYPSAAAARSALRADPLLRDRTAALVDLDVSANASTNSSVNVSAAAASNSSIHNWGYTIAVPASVANDLSLYSPALNYSRDVRASAHAPSSCLLAPMAPVGGSCLHTHQAADARIHAAADECLRMRARV